MVFTNITNQLKNLIDLLKQLQTNQYIQKIEHLSNASVGGHCRHIIELLECTIGGYEKNKVDYINRTRNILVEQDPKLAIDIIKRLMLDIILPDKTLKITVNGNDNNSDLQVNTTYFRELIYNEEHIIHHLALIKVGLIEMNLQIVNDSFGVAPSTLLYQSGIKDSKQ